MSTPAPTSTDDPWGDPEATRLWRDLVRIHPFNLEDPVRDRYEKPHYLAAAHRIAEAARAFGLDVRTFDPTHEEEPEAWHGVPRPNVIVDLDVGAAERVLILAHYDVVPVPEEQLGRWRTPPTEATRRDDGRWYGRGTNDDLGSGVVASLLALRRLRESKARRRNVRLLVCCDEETGGAGGIEALRHRDASLHPHDPERFVQGDVAIIPDGAPHATAASSGLAFVDATLPAPSPLADAIRLGGHLNEENRRALATRSRYPSPDYPDHGAPAPVITGRATVTRFDYTAAPASGDRPELLAAHAETDAPNFIPESVALGISGAPGPRAALGDWLAAHAPEGFRVQRAGATGLRAPAGAELWQVVGAGGHGGSPHRAKNPVPVTLELLKGATAAGLLAPGAGGATTFAVDLRLIPESTLAEGLDPVLAELKAWARREMPAARIEAPAARCRRGYCLPLDEPNLTRLAGILATTMGGHGIYGEYGGTDASSLADVIAPSGRPLPAIVFGSMDREARIHDAEESASPELLRGSSETIRRFVAEP